jgi:hypothetical protein
MVMSSRFSGRKSDGLSMCGYINGDAKSGIWKNRLIKYDIARDVNVPGGFI